MINERYKNSIKNAYTYPGADINSDHILLVMKMKLKLKIPHRKNRQEKADLQLLKIEDIRTQYTIDVKNRYDILLKEEPDQSINHTETIDRQWRCLKGGIKQALAETVPKTERKKKNEWMTGKILNMMNARRNIKIGSAERERLESKIRLECKKAKEKWYSDTCTEIENLEKRKNMQLMHEKVKELTDRKKNIRTGNGCIMSKAGDLLFEKNAVKERWVQYIHDLYNDENRGIRPEYVGDDGPSITQDEVSEAIKKMKDKKATGVDEISTECLKGLDPTSLDILTDLFNKIYKTGYIPNDLPQSIFITIPKKPKALECSDFRTISLMSHVMKAFLKIILHRNEKEIRSRNQ
jgi:hypothetical protein